MPKPKTYFRELPNFQYLNRSPDKESSIDYTTVKNFFKRVSLKSNLFDNITFFDKYVIEGDDRPDNVAFKVYKDSNLDWIVLLSNNIIDVYNEWPLSRKNFESYLLSKYGKVENLYKVHHYETKEVKDTEGVVIIPGGLILQKNIIEWEEFVTDQFGNQSPNPNYLKLVPYKRRFFDSQFFSEVTYTDILVEVTNYDYEIKLDEEKREIYLIKPKYLPIVFNDIKDSMEYKKGSEQYVSRTLKRGDDFSN